LTNFSSSIEKLKNQQRTKQHLKQNFHVCKQIPFPVKHSIKLEADRYAQCPGNRITFPRSRLRRRQQRSQFAATDKFDKIIGTPNQYSIS
jgi:hypothetical protein